MFLMPFDQTPVRIRISLSTPANILNLRSGRFARFYFACRYKCRLGKKANQLDQKAFGTDTRSPVWKNRYNHI
jgi:hypothetical protein